MQQRLWASQPIPTEDQVRQIVMRQYIAQQAFIAAVPYTETAQ